jgi:Fanconi anemia group M protein
LGAYSSLISHNGLTIFFTKNPSSTCELLFALAKHEQLSKKNTPRIAAKQKALTLPQCQRLLIESLPSTGPKLAQNLLIHFGSPRNILSADAKELENVPLLGKKRAKLIKNVLDSVYPYEKQP